MKKWNERAKGMIVGVLIAILIMSAVTVAAHTVTRELTYGVRVTANGQLIHFDEDSQPFVIEGRTFLPVRAIANALGVAVYFDESTNMVFLGEIPNETVYVPAPQPIPAPAPPPEPEPVPPPAPEPPPQAQERTVSQTNAIRAAENYIRIMSFSRSGLINQLEFEGYSSEDATFGVDNITVNWNEQAALKAQSYMDLMPMSRDGLIRQLEFEGFTREQAEYGANAVGL